MTREEVIKFAEHAVNMTDIPEVKLFYGMAAAALTPPTQEQMERVCGAEWIKKHRHRGGFRRYTGTDDMGEVHTITVDERAEYDDLYCSTCGKQSADNFLNFCPNCGSPMTDKAVQIVIKRLEALYGDR